MNEQSTENDNAQANTLEDLETPCAEEIKGGPQVPTGTVTFFVDGGAHVVAQTTPQTVSGNPTRP